MPSFEFGRFYIAYNEEYDYSFELSEWYPLAIFEVGISLPKFTFKPDFSHLEWLAAVWGFEWHKSFAPYSDEAPF